jgi:hypothetical protein
MEHELNKDCQVETRTHVVGLDLPLICCGIWDQPRPLARRQPGSERNGNSINFKAPVGSTRYDFALSKANGLLALDFAPRDFRGPSLPGLLSCLSVETRTS